MKAEAEANADADREAREKVDKLNAADSLVFQTEKQIKEYGDKIPADKKETINKAVADLKEAHKIQDIAKVDAATEALNTAWQAASQDIYNAQQSATPPQDEAPSDNGSSDTEDVTDVEFEEVDEKK
jgi:molecular chaperone DnaK